MHKKGRDYVPTNEVNACVDRSVASAELASVMAEKKSCEKTPQPFSLLCVRFPPDGDRRQPQQQDAQPQVQSPQAAQL